MKIYCASKVFLFKERFVVKWNHNAFKGSSDFKLLGFISFYNFRQYLPVIIVFLCLVLLESTKYYFLSWIVFNMQVQSADSARYIDVRLIWT